MQIGKWIGDDIGLDDVSLEELKPGDYVFREYQNATDAQAPITLFIEEDTCLPVRGWVVTDRRNTNLSRGDGLKFTANQSVMSRADDRILVEYWYLIHGRTVASQSWAVYYLTYDRIRLNRSDGAMVMLKTHLKRGESIDAAQKRLTDFEFRLTPLLDRYIPR